MESNYNLETSKYILADRIWMALQKELLGKGHSSDTVHLKMFPWQRMLWSCIITVPVGSYPYIGMAVLSIYSFNVKH